MLRAIFSLSAFLITSGAAAYAAVAPEAFSSLSPGAGFGNSWTLTTLPQTSPTRFTLTDADGQTVVRAEAANAAASLGQSLRWNADARPQLGWRWRIDRVVEQSNISTKEGDDFAARLYVFFEYPLDRLSLVERTKLHIARWWYGKQVPAAALCYVWANREQINSTTWNAYTSRVRMIVLRNATSAIGSWVEEQRNLAADFRIAFGDVTPVVTGIAIAADTDQTNETVTAWFGDIRLAD